MKKYIFYAVLFIASCILVKFYSDEKYKAYQNTGYIITLTPEKITVSDPETGKIILTEKYDSKSNLAKAILKDNE